MSSLLPLYLHSSLVKQSTRPPSPIPTPTSSSSEINPRYVRYAVPNLILRDAYSPPPSTTTTTTTIPKNWLHPPKQLPPPPTAHSLVALAAREKAATKHESDYISKVSRFKADKEKLTKAQSALKQEKAAFELQMSNEKEVMRQKQQHQLTIALHNQQQQNNNPYQQGLARQSSFDKNKNNPFRSAAAVDPDHPEALNENDGRNQNIAPSLKRKFEVPTRTNGNGGGGATKKKQPEGGKKDKDKEELPEELQHLDPELVEKIRNDIIETGEVVTFNDISGLANAKQIIREVVIWPLTRPDLFTGLRSSAKGLLLFGPPGTGKTLIAKAISHEAKSTFFSISSSSLTSKWIGEGEKLVKTLFAVAGYEQPSVVFIDEVDSLLTARKADELEASRRLKTEFLVQLDGTGTANLQQVLIIGATNRPQELDDAARRRFVKRLYIPLPAKPDRSHLIMNLLKRNSHSLTDADVAKLAGQTEGFSGADLKSLCGDAALGPIRDLGPRALEVKGADVAPISAKHFKKALKTTKPSVAPGDIDQYLEWNKTYGGIGEVADGDDDDSSVSTSGGDPETQARA